MSLKLTNKRVVVPISNTIDKKGFFEILAKVDGAFAIKIHSATLVYLLLEGVNPIEEAHKRNLLIFVDEKFDEIPSEVEKCARRWQDNGVDILTCHSNGTVPMMKAMRAGADKITTLGVTVLTTIEPEDCFETFGTKNIAGMVCERTRQVESAGLDGTVSAPADLRHMLAEGIDLAAKIRLVPNIRFKDADAIANDDQNADRSMDPFEVAKICGKSALMVIGRPIYGADNPATMLALAQERFEAGLAAT